MQITFHKMMCVSFVTIFGICCVLLPSEGQIIPPEREKLVFLNESAAKIQWSLGPDTGSINYRSWSFRSSGGNKTEFLAEINRVGTVTIFTKLYEIDVEKPATLVLKNVNESYDGKYEFAVIAATTSSSKVTVFIARTPIISANCSNPTTLNQGDDFGIECKGTNGNPPANVAWYKNDQPLFAEGKEKAILRFRNVDKSDSGTYKCVAKSGREDAKNETECGLNVNYPPEYVQLMFIRSNVDESVSITCLAAEARPESSYEIYLNETILLISDKTYTIPQVNSSHIGNYTCVGVHILGNVSSDPKYLSLVEPTTTPLPTTTAASPSNETSRPVTTSSIDISSTLAPTKGPVFCSAGCIVGIVGGVLVVILIIVLVVYYCKKRARNGYKGNANVNPDDGRGVNHYELEEDNAYNSVKGDNSYDSVNPPDSSASTSKPPKDTMPPVYAAVDKNNREGKTLYATLDSVALESDGSKKKKDDRPPPTEYADINFLKKEPDQNAGEAV